MKKIVVSFSLLIVAIGSLQAQVIDKVIAKVDNYYILKSELESTFLQYASQPNAPSKPQILESLLINKMMLAKADIDSVLIEDKRVDAEMNARFDQIKQRMGDEKNIEQAYGKTVAQLKSELRQNLKDQLLGQKMQSKITEDVKITPNEVRKFFNAIPKDSLPYLPAEVEVAQLVRLAKITKAQKEELRGRLIDYKRRVQKGEDFAQIAKDHSEDFGSGKQGGDLGYAKRGSMVAPFEAAALGLKNGEMSDVVESDFGFHLIQLIDVRGAEYRARHILLRPDYQRLDLTDATRFLDSMRTLIQRDSIKFEKAAKLYSEDKLTADNAGMLMDPQTRSTRMSLDQSMETNLYFTLDTMQVKTISKPLPYRTEDEKSAMRILYYKIKYPSHTADLEKDYQKMYTAALARKRNSAIDEWFKKAKSEVYIYIDPEYKDAVGLRGLGQ